MKRFKNILTLVAFACSLLSVKAQTMPIADPGFKQYLLDSMPTVLDASQNLITANAAGVTIIECPNYNIASINELVYFTGLTTLNITKNPITALPDISNTTGLTKLLIGDTKIKTLPDLSLFPNLKKLDIHRLYLTTFPDVSQNIKLEELIVNTNNFTSIPVLNLPKLKVLDVALTNQTTLPDLSNLKSLRSLACFRNSLQQLPDLSTLDSLVLVDASTNQLNVFPSISATVTTLYLDNNLLTSIPSLLPYPALAKVRLHKNYLSFEDLLPLTSLPNYSTIYTYSPQNRIPVGTSQTITEFTPLTIDSKIDTNVAAVVRQWYFNNTPTSQSNRFYQLKQTQLSDQGTYYCSLTHPAFPGLTIQTDNFTVTVMPCVNMSGVTYEIIGSTCLKQGSLKVNLAAQPGSNYTFELEGLQSHKIYTSTSGQFLNLADLQYNLTVIAPTGCKYTMPDPISIPREECAQLVLTPNDDGIDDTYYFSQTGTAKVVDKFGNVACQLKLPILWDGTSNGQRIPVGYYFITINNGEEILKVSIIY